MAASRRRRIETRAALSAHLPVLLSVLILAGACSARTTRLLLTFPCTAYVKAFSLLVKQGTLSADGLEIVGIHHEDEYFDYEPSRRYVREHGLQALVKFEEVRGQITGRDVFRTNGLTSAFRKLFQQSDGIVFTGGPDCPPCLYGERTSLLTRIMDPPRHLWEISFLAHLAGGSRNPGHRPFLARRPAFPMLCICLGMQSLNVATGGTLVQDIPSELYGCATAEDVLALPAGLRHKNYLRVLTGDRRLDTAAVHPIRLIATWPFAPAVSPEGTPLVCSVHHQCIERMGRDLIPIATSTDGKVIEAISHHRFRGILGVQFHPERSQVWDPTLPQLQGTGAGETRTTAGVMARSPESLAFHRALFAWFGRKLARSRRLRTLSGRRSLLDE